MNRRILFGAATVMLCLAFAYPGRADTGDLQAAIDSAHEPIFDGLGSLHHPVTTKVNSILAQKFFDQGLTLVYAFNHDEAAGSFEQAAQYDPDMAMGTRTRIYRRARQALRGRRQNDRRAATRLCECDAPARA